MIDLRISTPDNLARCFFDFAKDNPSKTVLIEPLSWDHTKIIEEKHWTYFEFSKLVQLYQKRLDAQGFNPGDRILMLLPISAKMYALISALFANGLVPVFIDSTMAKKAFIKSIRLASPKAIFSTAAFFKKAVFLPLIWRSRLFTFGEDFLFSKNWMTLKESEASADLASISPDSESLITFTSGSTGNPKAANRTHSLLHCQREISHKLWTNDDDIELTFFPMVVLTNLAFGVTTVLPALNNSQLNNLSAETLTNQIERNKVSCLAAPPSILNRLSEEKKISSVERLVTGGAPVPKWLVEKTQNIFINSENFVVYGSTEAEPISFVHFNEIIEAGSNGYLVGAPISDIELRVVSPIGETPIISEPLEALPTNTVGEIIIKGPHVVREYLFNELANQQIKIRDANNEIWHRTGDTGYFDSKNRLWLTGRSSQRFAISGDKKDLYPIEHSLENAIQGRVGLVQDDRLNLHIYLEKDLDEAGQRQLAGWRSTLAPLDIQTHLKPALPVDKRHFWKIERERLADL